MLLYFCDTDVYFTSISKVAAYIELFKSFSIKMVSEFNGDDLASLLRNAAMAPQRR